MSTIWSKIFNIQAWAEPYGLGSLCHDSRQNNIKNLTLFTIFQSYWSILPTSPFAGSGRRLAWRRKKVRVSDRERGGKKEKRKEKKRNEIVMERKALIVSSVVGFFGLLSAATGFGAEGTRIKVSLFWFLFHVSKLIFPCFSSFLHSITWLLRKLSKQRWIFYLVFWFLYQWCVGVQ